MVQSRRISVAIVMALLSAAVLSFKHLTLCGDGCKRSRQNVPLPRSSYHIKASAFANRCTAHMHAPALPLLNHHADHISGLKTVPGSIFIRRCVSAGLSTAYLRMIVNGHLRHITALPCLSSIQALAGCVGRKGFLSVSGSKTLVKTYSTHLIEGNSPRHRCRTASCG